MAQSVASNILEGTTVAVRLSRHFRFWRARALLLGFRPVLRGLSVLQYGLNEISELTGRSDRRIAVNDGCCCCHRLF
ncbi:hypothetical protein PC118_g19579 [Phytophthora cactorum]|uniref:Uncharacterized protein n=1 Tax=Phytophthora cactorum TaxID=29920 RepID=A0A8T0Z763_9STRA|nr:hypothetical protein PC113_g10410 [Phytophthora cactorum]KAG2965731.1 hypothetical protein PC118_g19579 [Phytophthora cactorum]